MAKDFKIKLPLRNKEDLIGSSLSEVEFDMLDMYILSPLLFSDIWIKFKGVKGTKQHEKVKANEFFATHDAQSYLEKRQRQLLDWISNDSKPSKKQKKENLEVTKEDIQEITQKMLQLAKDGDFDALKAVFSKTSDSIKLGDDVEPPRRYLPITCSICPYKIFCEKETVDMCEMCKYKHYANENGVKYNKQNQLEEHESDR